LAARTLTAACRASRSSCSMLGAGAVCALIVGL
jgi:hypothetical protein